MNPQDRELVSVVYADLQHVALTWDRCISKDQLRREADLLRRLLVYDDYGKAWRAVGLDREPMIQCRDVRTLIGSVPPGRVSLAQTGGRRAIEVLGAVLVRGAASHAFADHARSAGIPCDLSQPLSAFRESFCMIVDGSLISRRDLIKYCAEKLGSAHFDPSRDGAPLTATKYRAMDQVASWQTADLPPVFLELNGIGQCLAKAPDTQAFVERSAGLLA